MVVCLPIYKIRGKFYFFDKKLGEYRNIENPFDVLEEEKVSLEDIEKITEKDRKKISEFFGEESDKK